MANGSTSQESAAFSALNERHQLECPCERRTGWCRSLVEALQVWGERGETLLPVIKADSNLHSILARRTLPVVASGPFKHTYDVQQNRCADRGRDDGCNQSAADADT